MAVPAWKLALQERKKKQDEEEQLKKNNEEQQKLASLPAWKRAILLREKKTAGASAPPPSDASSSRSVSKLLGTSSGVSKQSSTAQHPQKWQVAVERVKGPDSPVLKRYTPVLNKTSSEMKRPSPILKRAAIAHAPTPNKKESSSAPTPQQSTKTSETTSQKPPQRSVLNRWNAGVSSQSPSVRRSSSMSIPSNNGGESKHSNSPAITHSIASKRPATTTSTPKVVSSTSATSTSAIKPAATSAIKPVATSTTKTAAHSVTTNAAASADVDDPALAKLPQWKKALIIKRRRAQQNCENKERSNSVGEDETDSGFIPVESSSNGKDPANPTPKSASIVIKQPVPEVVNRQAETKPAQQRLVQQEGKTLHPPIYKEVDQWANVGENDEKFKNLPLWKQALIKRRRTDIAVRSGQPVPVSSTVAPETTNSPQKVRKENERKTLVNDSNKNVKENKSSRKPISSKNKQTTSKSAENKRNRTVSQQSAKKRTEEQTDSATVKSVSASRPTRTAPATPTGAHSKMEDKTEPMFSYNFSKASRHSLDTGGSSSDDTDSDLEDAIVTNLDEDSDASDSGIVLQRYTPSGEQKNSTEVKRTSSILVVPGAKKKKRLRRVAWSDSQLVCEHTYPKYDYFDYDDREEAKKEGKSEFSHRLHPSLLPPTDGDPYTAGFSPPGYMQGGSLSNFVPSSLSPTIMESSYSDYRTGENSSKEEHSRSPTSGPVEHDYAADYYSDQTTAGALLW